MVDQNVMTRGDRKRRAQRGATAIEYGLIVALISVAILTVLLGFGGRLSATFDALAAVL